MPEDQNIIFKLQLDASGYITGVNAAADATTKRFVDAQRKANDALLSSKKALDDVTTEIESLQRGIRSSEAEGQFGFADTLRKQLDEALQRQAALTTEVENNTKAYNDATNAAEDFFRTQAKAQQLVQSNAPAPVPNVQQLSIPFQEPGAQLSLFEQIPSGVIDAVDQTTQLFGQLKEELIAVNAEIDKLDKGSAEFAQASAFRDFATTLVNLHDSLKLVGDTTEQSRTQLTQYRDELVRQSTIIKTYADTLDKTSSAYQAFNGLLQQSDAVLKIYNASLKETQQTTEQTGEKHLSLRTRISQLRTELASLTEAGKEDTKEFQDMEIEAAKLTHEYQEQQQRIHILASEHKALDFGKAAIRGAIGAFETLASVQVLFGEKQEELEKITLKLFAAMQLLNGLDELFEATQKNGTLAVLARRAANITTTASTNAFSAAIGTATGATKAFRVALLSTVVGAVLVGIGVLIAKFIQWRKEMEEANKVAKLTQEINEKAIEGYAQQVSSLDILTKELTDHNLTQQQRISLANEYNKTAEEGNQIDTTQIENTNLITSSIQRQVVAIRQRATAEAARQVTTEKATKEFQDQVKLETLLGSKRFQFILPELKIDTTDIPRQIEELKKLVNKQLKGLVITEEERARVIVLNETIDALEELNKSQKDYNTTLGITAKLTEQAIQQQHLILPDTAKTVGQRITLLNKDIENLKKEQAELALTDTATQKYYATIIKLREAEVQALTTPQGVKDFGNEVASQLADIQSERFKALQIRIQAQIQADQEVISDEKKSYEVRFAATQDYYNKSLSLIIANAEFEKQQSRQRIEQTRIELQKRLDDPSANLSIQQRNDINTQLSRLATQESAKEIAIEARKNADLQELDRTSEKQRTDLFKARTDEIRKVDREVLSFEQQTADQSLQLIRDEFERRAAIIEQNEQKELENAKLAQEDRLRQLELDRLIIGEENYYKERQRIVTTGEQQINNIIRQFAQQRQDLAADTFQKTLTAYEKAISLGDTIRTESEQQEISQQAERFQKGKITFERFQREIVEIERKYNAQRRAGNLQVLDDEITALEQHIEQVKGLNPVEDTRLADQLVALRKRRADLQKESDIANVQDQRNITQERLSDIQAYTDAIGSMAQAVIGFWQAANDAEEKALDRSIQLQERRVEEAQRIADRGNATYLKSETDRLRQLEVERENSARRQLGIDAALQASQILVGITGAIAKIGTGLGAAETIASIAVIVGALATGYGLIKQLQANQPRLKEGTPYLQRGTHPAGTDTIPAWLNEGEAVIPTETNKKYKPVIEAVYHEKVPAEVMNSFVKGYKEKISDKQYAKLDDRAKTTYLMYQVAKKFIGEKHDEKLISKEKYKDVSRYMEVVNSSINKQLETKKTSNIHEIIRDVVFDAQAKIIPFKMDRIRDTTHEKSLVNFVDTFYSLKEVPQPDYGHIAEVNQMQLGYDGKLRSVLEQQNELIKQNNEHHKETQKILKAMGISMSIDQNGVAVIAMDAIKQKQIDAKL